MDRHNKLVAHCIYTYNIEQKNAKHRYVSFDTSQLWPFKTYCFSQLLTCFAIYVSWWPLLYVQYVRPEKATLAGRLCYTMLNEIMKQT